MRLRSARQVWHDATLTSCRSSFEALVEIERLGIRVQTTDISHAFGQIVHSVLAGHVLSAIDKLPSHVRAFGNAMYAANPSADDLDTARHMVFNMAYTTYNSRMYAKKYDKALYVAMAVFDGYRRRHQGGQSEGQDMFPSPKAFRAHVLDEYGVELPSERWGRDWKPFIGHCGRACDEMDRQALAPIGALLYRLKETA